MKVTQVASQLRTTNLEESIRFYVEQLGFALAFRYSDFYAGITMCDFALHLKLVDEPDPSIPTVREAGHFHLYIEVVGARAYAKTLQTRDVRLLSEPHDTDYSRQEFSLEDNQGHTLYFAEAAA